MQVGTVHVHIIGRPHIHIAQKPPTRRWLDDDLDGDSHVNAEDCISLSGSVTKYGHHAGRGRFVMGDCRVGRLVVRGPG